MWFGFGLAFFLLFDSYKMGFVGVAVGFVSSFFVANFLIKLGNILAIGLGLAIVLAVVIAAFCVLAVIWKALPS